MKVSFVPDVGDILWMSLSPTSGHEQSGHRPVLTLTPAAYNAKRGLLICCPITSRIGGYPFEVAVDTEGISGVVIADQVKSVDWQARGARLAGRASVEVTLEVRAKLGALLLTDT
ncbi:MAG: endoribonuclease MazF [Aquiluna sp.]